LYFNWAVVSVMAAGMLDLRENGEILEMMEE